MLLQDGAHHLWGTALRDVALRSAQPREWNPGTGCGARFRAEGAIIRSPNALNNPVCCCCGRRFSMGSPCRAIPQGDSFRGSGDCSWGPLFPKKNRSFPHLQAQRLREEALPPRCVLLPPGARRAGIVAGGRRDTHVRVARDVVELLPRLRRHPLYPQPCAAVGQSGACRVLSTCRP